MSRMIVICLLLFLAVVLWIANVMQTEEINRHGWKSVEEMEAYFSRHKNHYQKPQRKL